MNSINENLKIGNLTIWCRVKPGKKIGTKRKKDVVLINNFSYLFTGGME
jgi:hypothetical protein